MILDTHTLLWMDRNDAALGAAARREIESAWRSGRIAVSAISFWEVAMLADRARVSLPVSVEKWRSDWLEAGLVEIPLDGRIALHACRLVDFHRDPADRFIIATAIDRGLRLVSADRQILAWPGNLERLDASE